MLSYHGWFQVFGHWLEENDFDYDDHAIHRRLETEAEKLSAYHNIDVRVLGLNGGTHVLVACDTNRKRGEYSEVLEFVHLIAAIAPGSYGVLYVQDSGTNDVALNDRFECYVMRKGVVEVLPDPFFTPCSEKIE